MSAAALVMLALTGASLSGTADAATQPHQFEPSFVVPPNDNFPAVPSDSQLIAAAAPERAILAAKARAHALAVAAAKRLAASDAAAGYRSVGASAASWSASRTLNVWTYGFQAQVNACRGGVDLTGAYHTRTVGEHWSCGGAEFPETPGTIVQFTGIDAGTYRVIGLVATLDAYTAHTGDIPHGYAMLFQTCRNGNSRTTIFIALARI